MLDVGGAVGHVARHFSRCGVRATLFDRENVLPMAREFLGSEGADIALVGGDFTQSLPAGPFDLVYLGNVYHIYGPGTNARVTREVFSVLSPGGTIAIQDLVLGRSRRAALFAVNMLQATEDGGVWTEAQYREWLTAAGFARVEILDLHDFRSPAHLGQAAAALAAPPGLRKPGSGQASRDRRVGSRRQAWEKWRTRKENMANCICGDCPSIPARRPGFLLRQGQELPVGAPPGLHLRRLQELGGIRSHQSLLL